MGRKSFIDLGVAVLGIGVTTAVLKFSGKTLCAMHLLKKVARKEAKQTFDILIIFGLIPFSPRAERFLRLSIQLLISSTVLSHETRNFDCNILHV